MGGQSSGAIGMTPRSKSITNGDLTPKARSSASILVPIDNVNDKPPQSPEGVKKNCQKYVTPLISVIFWCSLILLTKQILSG